MSSLETPSRLKTALITPAAWLVTFLFYAIGIVTVAALFADASTTTASNAAMALVVIELIVAIVAIAFVVARSRTTFQTLIRWIWVAVYAVLQLGSCAVAGFITLLALYR